MMSETMNTRTETSKRRGRSIRATALLATVVFLAPTIEAVAQSFDNRPPIYRQVPRGRGGGLGVGGAVGLGIGLGVLGAIAAQRASEAEAAEAPPPRGREPRRVRVIEVDEDAPPVRAGGRGETPPPKQKPPKSADRTPPSNIRVPARGETRFVAGELLIEVKGNGAIQPIATRHRLEVLASLPLRLTGSTLHRLRANDGRSTADVLTALRRERTIAAAQPNWVYTLQQGSVAPDAPAVTPEAAPSEAKTGEVGASTPAPTPAPVAETPAAPAVEPAATAGVAPAEGTAAATAPTPPAPPSALPATAPAATEAAAAAPAEAPAAAVPPAPSVAETPAPSAVPVAETVAPGTPPVPAAAEAPAVVPVAAPVAIAPAAVESAPAVAAAASAASFATAATAVSAPPQMLPGQYAAEKLRLPGAHGRVTGRDVLVAVIDTGADVGHPELAGAVEASFDALTGVDPAPGAHGTAMAGAVAARLRLSSSAPAARLLVARAFGPPAANGVAQGSTFHVVACLDWAVARGARVVSMSFAGPSNDLLSRSLAAARGRGVIAVAAAGNAGPQSPPLYPAADANVIAVTASDPDDRILPAAVRGAHVLVTAPGVDIVVAAPKGGYDVTSGTSVAAAEVSGVVALLLEKRGDLKPEEARRILAETAIDLGPKGRDPIFGAGLVDAEAAVAAATRAR